jgi:isoquinoline 1-oxidoreductase beta subunit
MESGIIYGLSAALFGRITLKEGRVQQSNFHDYRVVRLNEAPAIEVHIIPSSEKPGGAGEPGTPPIAPAVGNAVFRLTNRRLRSLPFDLSGAI